jgi:hypothetical protein
MIITINGYAGKKYQVIEQLMTKQKDFRIMDLDDNKIYRMGRNNMKRWEEITPLEKALTETVNVE